MVAIMKNNSRSGNNLALMVSRPTITHLVKLEESSQYSKRQSHLNIATQATIKQYNLKCGKNEQYAFKKGKTLE
eukprot:4682971-Amphidinium_carterae.1